MNDRLLGSSYGYCKRRGVCSECKNELDLGEKQTTTVTRNKTGQIFTFRAHTDCWTQRRELWYETHEYEQKPRGTDGGRPKLQLSIKDKRIRATLLNKLKRIAKKKRRMIQLGLRHRLNELELEEEGIVEKLDTVGGLPRSRS